MKTLHLAIIGGGRWGRTHLNVLNSIPNINIQITWVTKKNLTENRKWCFDNKLTKVKIVDELTYRKVDGVIIATKSNTHSQLLEEFLHKKIPILCEKPFAMSKFEVNKLVDLSLATKTPAAMNIEFIHASYISDLKRIIASKDIKSIKIEWLDPLVENKDGLIKISDVGTPIAFDHIIHCWSLLYVIFEQTKFNVKSVQYKTNGMIFTKAKLDSIEIFLNISRHHKKRVRKITINGNIILDFSKEPGYMVIDRLKSKNKWNSHKPMRAALLSFINMIKDKKYDPKESIQNTQYSILFCIEVYDMLKIEMENRLQNLSDMTAKEKEILLINSFSHVLAEKNIYLPIANQTDRNNFIKYLSKNRYIN